MPMILTLPDKYPLVILAASSTWFLNVYQYLNVSRAREVSGVEYPQLYAEKAEVEKSRLALLFNCAQRAHQNTLEHIPYILLTTFVSGLCYPAASSALCALWVVGRVLYTIGYSTGDPAKRITRGGFLGNISVTALGILSTTAAVQMVFAMYI